MFTTKMVKLFAVILGHDVESITEVLLREGVMQFINISGIERFFSEDVNKTNHQVSLDNISETRKRIEGFLHPVGIYPSMPQGTDLNKRIHIDIDKENDNLDKLSEKRESIRSRQRIIQQEVAKLEDIKRQFEIYGPSLSGIALSPRHSFLSIQIGKISTLNLCVLNDETKNIPCVNLSLGEENDSTNLLTICMKRDEERVRRNLDKAGWIPVELPGELQNVKKDVSTNLDSKLSTLIDEQKKLKDELDKFIVEKSEQLKEVWINLRINELFFKIKSYFKCSSRTVIFSGWLPASKKERLTKKIKQVTENRCYLEWEDAEKISIEKDKIPVQFRNYKIFSPFQMLVRNFGIPEYGTIDPTPFVMPIYLLMFGLMFADAGHGVVLTILGIIGTIFSKNMKENNVLKDLCGLIIWCGASSVIFGVLLGSYFGRSWFKPLWFDFHGIITGRRSGNLYINDIFDILTITVFFGITVIVLGLVFNWINLVRKRKWLELFLENGGIISGWIYIGGIYIASYMVNHNYKEVPEGNLIFLLVAFPALLLILKEPFHFLNQRKEGKENRFTLFTPLNIGMEWVVKLLEIFTGYLSNTLSFMRVAGLGIAHVCLMISFFSLANMAGGKGIIPVLILISGNILVIFLEGLSAGIQALRLNYYEFFTKFFHGTGKLYSPVSLSSRD